VVNYILDKLRRQWLFNCCTMAF